MTSKKEQNESYSEFRKIKDKSDALKFLKERVPRPDSNIPYTPSDYRWMTMPLVAKLSESYHSFRNPFNIVSYIVDTLVMLCFIGGVILMALSGLWGWLLSWLFPISFRTQAVIFVVCLIGVTVTYLCNKAWAKPKQKAEQHFSEQINLAISVFEQELDPVSEWVENRYDIEKSSYKQPPPEYTYITPHEIEAAILQRKKEDQQPIDPAKESELEKILYEWKKVGRTKEGLNDRTHCILVDKKTLLEAPLLPGVQAYQE
jgi:hypothetical protein